MRSTLLIAITLFALSAFPETPQVHGVYHEASCPSVDQSRMPRLKRAKAEAIGLTPASDCHPAERMRYLGLSGAWGPAEAAPCVETATTQCVDGYTRSDGTPVAPYSRGRASESTSTGEQKTVHVNGYTRADGTYVRPHTRSAPDRH
jgi:hypothetical protein